MASMRGMQSDCAGDMHQKPSLLCKVHCEKSTSSSQASHDFAPVLSVLYAEMPYEQPVSFETFVRDHRHSLASAFPPLRIQYQSFRN